MNRATYYAAYSQNRKAERETRGCGYADSPAWALANRREPVIALPRPKRSELLAAQFRRRQSYYVRLDARRAAAAWSIAHPDRASRIAQYKSLFVPDSYADGMVYPALRNGASLGDATWYAGQFLTLNKGVSA